MGTEYLSADSKSAGLAERARRVMPGGNTRTTVFSAPYPSYVAEAHGATVTDVEGTTRIDFVNNYTSLIHGHAHPRIVAAVQAQLAKGTAFSFPTEAEVSLAETITDRVATIEQLRFTNSGTEAVMMAVQAARAFTGRRKIAKFEGCYHGAYLEESAGNPFDGIVLPFNDAEAVEQAIEQHAHELACVVVDPLPHRPGFIDPQPGFLERLSEAAKARGVLVISDEIISFRVGYNGAQARFGFQADLTTLAKIIGGGFPVGAFGGRADVMGVFDPRGDGVKVPHGGTFNANPVTMVAGQAAMSILTPAAFNQLATLGERVRTGLADLIETRDLKWQVSGEGSLFKLHPHMRPLLDFESAHPTPAEQASMERTFQAMFGAGVVVTPELAGCVSTAMTEADVDALLAAAEQALTRQF